MLTQEFPKAIFDCSVNRVGFFREIRIDYPNIVLHDQSKEYASLIQYCSEFEPTIDEYVAPGSPEVFYVNTYKFLGENVTLQRINMYEDSLLGKTELDYTKRQEFVDPVLSLCKVERRQVTNGFVTYRGSCPGFCERSYCNHAAYY